MDLGFDLAGKEKISGIELLGNTEINTSDFASILQTKGKLTKKLE